MSDIQAQYKSLISWADIFVDSDIEVKKMIAAYLIESVKVSRGYEVEVKFHVAYEQFCEAG
jgi:peroxiredoxin family protein